MNALYTSSPFCIPYPKVALRKKGENIDLIEFVRLPKSLQIITHTITDQRWLPPL